MNVNIPIFFVDKPKLDGTYISKEVYCKILNDYFSFHATAPVRIQYLNLSEEIGECTFYDLENKTANINLYNKFSVLSNFYKDMDSYDNVDEVIEETEIL